MLSWRASDWVVTRASAADGLPTVQEVNFGQDSEVTYGVSIRVLLLSATWSVMYGTVRLSLDLTCFLARDTVEAATLKRIAAEHCLSL